MPTSSAKRSSKRTAAKPRSRRASLRGPKAVVLRKARSRRRLVRSPALRREIPKKRPAPPVVGPRVRRNQAALDDSQWTELLGAVRELSRPNAPAPHFADFVQARRREAHQHQAHGLPYYLPWHRELLFQFESRLRQIAPRVALPYWNWLTAPEIPAALQACAEWGVTRLPAISIPSTMRAIVQAAMAAKNYNDFSNAREALDKSICQLIGGEMAQPDQAARDVLFWLHHAFLDKLWADWQKQHPKASPNSAAYDVWLRPQQSAGQPLFTHKAREMWSIAELGYRYQ